jgi:DNA-binding SARP family transcriptional activator/TolB-like protein
MVALLSLLTRHQSRTQRQGNLNRVNIVLVHEFRLLTMGRLTLQGGEGTPAADALRKQRRKLAVLATLAVERAPMARDALADMFWGDQAESRARHSLSEALSHIRRVLGPHSITTGRTDVELNPAAPLAVDAVDLRAAAMAERWGDVVRLYGGTFLDAVHPGDSARLEGWIERYRRELERLFLRACERECVALRTAARWDDACDVARRWLGTDPLAESAALALLGGLEAPGTAAADARALRAYEELRLRLARDGAVPGERVQARAAVLAERLSAQPQPMPVAVVDSASSVASDAVAESTEPLPPGHGRRFRLRHGAVWLLAGLVVTATSAALWLRPAASPAPESGTYRTAVLPFEVRGPAEYAYLREGVVDLLSADLDGAGPFRVVDPQAVLVAARGAAGDGALQLAERLGADLFVRGDVVVAGSRLRISAGLYRREPAGRRMAEATVEGAPEDLFQLVDRLTAELLAATGSAIAPLGRLAAVTTSSLPALKVYLDGEADFRVGLHASAFEAFRRATELDTTFALAHYRVAQAATWAVPPSWGWDSILARSRLAVAHADRLGPRARLLVEAYADWVGGAYDDAERGYRAIVRTYPDDVEAWYGLAEVLFHTNPVRGRSSVEAGPAFERALELEPGNVAVMTHLLRVRLREGRRAEVDSLVARLDSIEALPATAEFHALRAFSHGTEAERARALAELRASGNDELVRITAHRLAVFAGSLDGATRVLPLLIDAGLADDVRAHAHVWLAQLEIARGRWHAADSALAAAAALHPLLAAEQRALLAALPFAPEAPARIAAAEAALLRLDGDAAQATTYPWLAVCNGLHGILREYLLGILALRQGDVGAARRQASVLAARATRESRLQPRELARGLSESLLAHLAASTANDVEALARFDAARLRVSEGLLESQFGSQAHERWARAELLSRTGRLREALSWYASLAQISIDGMIYVGPAEARQAGVLEQLGDTAAAAMHYRRFLELWGDADPELGAWVAHARSRLEALR